MEVGFNQAKLFAEILDEYENWSIGTTGPLELLFKLLATSRSFVHFATCNISNDMIGVIAMLAAGINVRGIIGGITSQQVELLMSLKKQVPKLDVKVFGDKTNYDAPQDQRWRFGSSGPF